MISVHRGHTIDIGEGAAWYEYEIYAPNGLRVHQGFWSRKTTDCERLILWLKNKIDEAYNPPLSPTNPKSAGRDSAKRQAKKKPAQPVEQVVEFF
jgi:hypothetical protein